MWRTSCGERTLHGPEARLFAEALLSLLDEVHTGQLYDYDLGLRCFDDLTYGQKISVLAIIGNGLLKDDVPVVPLTAVPEGAIAAVFQHLRNSVTVEIDLPELGTRWRELIAVALREMEAEEVPKPTCRDQDEWDIGIQELSDCILWDADYEDGDLYLDRRPEETRELMDGMWIADDGQARFQMVLPMNLLLFDVATEIKRTASQAGLLMMKALIDEEVEQLAGQRYPYPSIHLLNRFTPRSTMIVMMQYRV